MIYYIRFVENLKDQKRVAGEGRKTRDEGRKTKKEKKVAGFKGGVAPRHPPYPLLLYSLLPLLSVFFLSFAVTDEEGTENDKDCGDHVIA